MTAGAGVHRHYISMLILAVIKIVWRYLESALDYIGLTVGVQHWKNVTWGNSSVAMTYRADFPIKSFFTCLIAAGVLMPSGNGTIRHRVAWVAYPKWNFLILGKRPRMKFSNSAWVHATGKWVFPLPLRAILSCCGMPVNKLHDCHSFKHLVNYQTVISNYWTFCMQLDIGTFATIGTDY